MPKGKPKKVAPTLLVSENFTLTLKLGNEVYKSSGTTAYEALSTLPIPDKIFLKGILTITRGEKQHELVLPPMRIKRLFYPVSRNMFAKQLNLLVS